MISLEDIKKARKRIESVADITPCVRAEGLSLRTQGNVWLKLETLQRTGSFKVRGAYNAISQLTEKEKKKGVIAASAGNHSQGVALASKKLRVKATIVMPVTTPLIKVRNTKALGAHVILHGENFDESFQQAQILAKKKKLVLIHAFNDEQVIAGQGTCALEILEQMPKVDTIVVPIGGGGLISGVAIAAKALNPKIKIIGVQAKGASAMYEAFRGKKKTIHPHTIADGIAIKKPGAKTLQYIKKYVDRIVLVDDVDMTAAILRLMERRKLIAEPAGVASLAAIHTGKVKVKGKNVVAIVSGGNIDVRLLSSIIREGMVKEGRIYEFSTVIPDRPGALQDLTNLIANLDVNILSVHHERLNPHANITQVEVDIILETVDKAHIQEVRKALKKGGYDIED